MNRRQPYVYPWSVESFTSVNYDLSIYAVGYEGRARYIADVLRPRSSRNIAFGFPDRKEAEFARNLAFFESMDCSIFTVDDQEFESLCHQRLREIRPVDGRITIGFDVSSMSRTRIAILIAAILDVKIFEVTVDCWYANAKFVPMPIVDAPVLSAKPIHYAFTGWADEPDSPCMVIFGLGYELDKALGTMEFLEPAAVWAFHTFGVDERFKSDVSAANRSFWDMMPTNSLIEYDILRPFDCFQKLEAVSFSALQQGRLVIVPFGPKIFTVCALAVACIHAPEVSVWRISSSESDPVINRVASGDVVGLRLVFPAVVENEWDAP